MSKPARPARRATPPAKRPLIPAAPRHPRAPRTRHDGWTPAKQSAFIEALAESGCVHEAASAAGMSRASAYALRTRADAQGFRLAWNAALDVAIRRLADECFSRAIHGEVVPHFYKGEQVGEHRRYDNKLAMFLLRYRDPLRYAATLDQMVYTGHPEAAAIAFARAQNRVLDEAHGMFDAPEPPTVAYEAEPVAIARKRQVQEAKQAEIDRADQTMRDMFAPLTDAERYPNRTDRDTVGEWWAKIIEEDEAARAKARAAAEALATPAAASTLSTSASDPPAPRGAIPPPCNPRVTTWP